MNFIEEFDLKNTKEIFLAETNYEKDEKALNQLKRDYPEKDKCMGL